MKDSPPSTPGKRYFACVWSLISDLDYMVSILKLPHYGSKKAPCAICTCTGGDAASSWKDCRKNAAWVNLFWKTGMASLAWPFTLKILCTHSWLLECVLRYQALGHWCHPIWFDPLHSVSMQQWYRKHKIESKYCSFRKTTVFYNQKKKIAPKFKGKATPHGWLWVDSCCSNTTWTRV